MLKKICNRCTKEKDITEFGKDSSQPTGIYPICKLCKKNKIRKGPGRKEKRELINNGFKYCGGCSEIKPLNQFHIVAITDKSTTGYHTQCKSCNSDYEKTDVAKQSDRRYRESGRAKINIQIYILKNPDKVKERRDKQNKTRYATDEAREINNGYKRVYVSKHPHKHYARIKVYHAVKAKKLPHISECLCVGCGNQAEQYHHPDYSRPLYVEPVCINCHNKIHSELKLTTA